MDSRDKILSTYPNINGYLIYLTRKVSDVDRRLNLQRLIHKPKVFFEKYTYALKSENRYEQVRDELRSALGIRTMVNINTIGKAIFMIYSNKYKLNKN